MKINHEETKETKKDQKKTFVIFVSSWLIFGGVIHVAMRRPETMKIAPGYASLPACFASINGQLKKPRTLEAMRTQGFSEEKP